MLTWVDEHVQPPKTGAPRIAGPAERPGDKVRERIQTPAQSAGRTPDNEAEDAPAPVRRAAEPAKADYRRDEAVADKRGIESADGPENDGAPDREAPLATRDDTNMSGPPTEKIPAASKAAASQEAASQEAATQEGGDLDEIEVPDDEMAVREAGPRDQPTPRGSVDRSASGHQRQMFAPGREPRQAGSGVIR
jgi:hypothetical protein